MTRLSRKLVSLLLFSCWIYPTMANSFVSAPKAIRSTDTLPDQLLERVEVKAFLLPTVPQKMPIAVSVADSSLQLYFPQQSWVPILNSLSGVRMEERSPGSYRLSVRGSLIRSPFGIRNIKMYWNGLPFSDAGGNTYFNLVPRHVLQNIEVLKGPAGSVYGSGTGGAVLLESVQSTGTEMMLSGGSYGNAQLYAKHGWEKNNSRVVLHYNRFQSDGYRNHTALQRDAALAEGQHFLSSLGVLQWTVLAADLDYRTPGGLNLQQFRVNPAAARPATAVLPGAEEQNAGIRNRTAFGGLRMLWKAKRSIQQETAISFSYTNFENPFITNYEERKEPGTAIRHTFQHTLRRNSWVLQSSAGVEAGYQTVHIKNHENNQGEKGALFLEDRIRTGYWFPFLQTYWSWKNKWQVQSGVSFNQPFTSIKRISEGENDFTLRQFSPQWMPRLSVLYQITPSLHLTGILSRGYSAPTVAEIRPSDGSFRNELNPESGWNREIGIRLKTDSSSFSTALNVFRFSLTETIVRRLDGSGNEFFVNAGSTIQQGLEWEFSFRLGKERPWVILSSITWYDFRFQDYRSGNSDFSGNKVPGIAPLTASLVVSKEWPRRLRWSASLYHADAIRLNDAGDESASPYYVAQARLQYDFAVGNQPVSIFAAGDNLLNQRYSLGNDLNAVGRRYYNAAMPRNIEAGIRVSL